MRTSVDIPDPLLRRAKKIARDRGTTLRELVLEGLRRVMDARTHAPPYTLEDCSFGSGGLVDGMSWSDAERMRELTYDDVE